MRRMIFVVLLAISLVLPACTMWKEKPALEWAQATGGEQLERLFWKDLKANNWAQLEAHLSSTFVFLTPSGPLDRPATLEHLKKLQLTEYSLGDFSIGPNGSDIIVTYTVLAHGTFDGKPLPATPLRMMTVWQQAKNGWVAIAHADVAAK